MRLLQVMALMAACTGMALAGPTCPDPGCSEPVSKAVQSVAKAEEEAFAQMAAQTVAENKSALEACLSGIQGFGLGLNFNVPSLDNLFNTACSSLQSMANERINAVKGKFTSGDMFGLVNAGATSGANFAKVKVTDISQNVVQRLQKPLERGFKR